jgi:hypothetical protein
MTGIGWCDRCGETKPVDGVALEVGVPQRTTPTSQEHRLGSYSERSRLRVLARESRWLRPYVGSMASFFWEFLSLTGALALLLRWIRGKPQALGELVLFMERKQLARTHRVRRARFMVFVSGPRPVGKTTLARRVVGRRAGYLSWDVAEDRERILRRELPPARLWAFDEIHKYRGWRNYLKGLFDGRSKGQQILVTGSARLKLYRRGGDSLHGRYHSLRLHPLSAAELGLRTAKELRDLLALGGFPEPFFSRGAGAPSPVSTGLTRKNGCSADTTAPHPSG